MANAAGDTSTDLTDSLLHTNMKRVVIGVFCGIASGLVLLGLTTLYTPVGANKTWWIQLLATFFYGGNAMAFNAGSEVLTAGLCLHLFVSAFCGLLVGKMTKTHSIRRLATYGLVLGGLCWLASNMFAPDLFNVQGLEAVGEWERVSLFVPFGILIGVFLGIASSVFDL